MCDEVHLWLASYDDIVDTALHSAYRRLLNESERAQESRFHFARDRLRYLVTRALVRTVLSRYVPSIGPGSWMFSTNAYGRPQIVNPEAGNLSFNISHAHSMIVLGVTRGRALGVDVENVAVRELSIDVATRYFAPREVADLAKVPPRRQQYRIFEYWTLKESYIKARGMGLSLPLDKFSFHGLDADASVLEIDPVLNDDPARWQFWRFCPSPEYLVAVCAERVGREPTFIVRKTVPMLKEERVAPESMQRFVEDPVERIPMGV
jgi:4'-phosphopantetheinyl transferase